MKQKVIGLKNTYWNYEANALKKYYIAMDKKAKIYLAVTVQ